MQKRPVKKLSKNDWFLLVFISLVLIGCVVYFAYNINSTWQTLKEMFTNPPPLPPLKDFLPVLNVFIPPIIIIILLWRCISFKKWITETIGEGKTLGHHWYRFILPILIALPFVFYVLLSGIKKSVPPVVEFSLVAVAPTLGGLILAAANRRSQKKKTYNELISIAQKLIVSTVLLIIFASLFFTSDFIGGTDQYSLDWSPMGFFRWGVLWGSVWSFYVGTFLFLLGISDLVLALRFLRKK